MTKYRIRHESESTFMVLPEMMIAFLIGNRTLERLLPELKGGGEVKRNGWVIQQIDKDPLVGEKTRRKGG